jgi:pimeloyl-ACP methyl ester carboxylesterase
MGEKEINEFLSFLGIKKNVPASTQDQALCALVFLCRHVVSVSGGALPTYETLVYEEKHNLRNLGVLPGLSDILAYPSAWSLIYWRQRDFYDSIGNFDPRAYWERLCIPALVIYGENDTNLPAEKSAEALRALGNRNINIKIYEGSGLALESPEGFGNRIFRENALEDIRDFIHSLHTAQS